jgi:hypothetical protein
MDQLDQRIHISKEWFLLSLEADGHTANNLLIVVLVVGFITNTTTNIALFCHWALPYYLHSTYTVFWNIEKWFITNSYVDNYIHFLK